MVSRPRLLFVQRYTRLLALGIFLMLIVQAHPQKVRSTPPRPAVQLAFVRGQDVWLAKADGSQQHIILRNASYPAWSPGRTKLTFVRNGEIWIANADGSGQRKLTVTRPVEGNAIAGSGMSLSWNPVTHRITFVESGRSLEGLPSSGLYDVSAATDSDGAINTLVDATDTGSGFVFGADYAPAWSPSGRYLAFVRNGDIWVARIHTEGTSPDQLAHATIDRRWDLSRLCAVAVFDSPTWRASRENLGPTRVSWSPDERSLAYGAERLQGSGFAVTHVLELARSAATPVGLTVKKDRIVSNDGYQPCFSPDGRFIAYRCYGGDAEGIWVVRLDGTGTRHLIKNAEWPAW